MTHILPVRTGLHTFLREARHIYADGVLVVFVLQPRCAEPWTEVIFESEKEGKLEVSKLPKLFHSGLGRPITVAKSLFSWVLAPSGVVLVGGGGLESHLLSISLVVDGNLRTTHISMST